MTLCIYVCVWHGVYVHVYICVVCVWCLCDVHVHVYVRSMAQMYTTTSSIRNVQNNIVISNFHIHYKSSLHEKAFFRHGVELQ